MALSPKRVLLGEKTVTLAPDVWEYFPSSQAVNHALRTLISLIPEKPSATTRRTRAVHAAREDATTRLKDTNYRRNCDGRTR